MSALSGLGAAREAAARDAATAGVAQDLVHVHLPSGPSNRWGLMAAVFGRLVAQGVAEFDPALAAMRRAAAERMPGMDAAGRDMRMAWLLNDAVRDWDMARDRARFGLRRALAPMLVARAPSAALVAAARAVNAAAGGPLRDVEVIGEVRREVYWAARRSAPRRGGAGARA
jgi:hypothetical protein